MNTWKHADEWRKSGKDFLIVVRHHTEEIPPSVNFDRLGPNRWTVYAYIYPKHKMCKEFTEEQLYTDATSKLPLHGGASLIKFHIDTKGERASVHVGADYNHYGDDEFSMMETMEEAREVFSDASDLFEFLSKE